MDDDIARNIRNVCAQIERTLNNSNTTEAKQDELNALADELERLANNLGP